MILTKGMRLPDKYRPLFLPLLFLCFSGMGQTYNPSTCCTVSNKAYGSAQATTTDGRSWFYDATNFVMRDYNGTTEVFSYLNLPKYRSGHFPIYVHSGGLLQGNGVWLGGTTLVYWFKDSTGNANLVRWYTDSTGMPGGPFYAVANNLSEGNAGLIKGNLALDNVDNTSDAQKNAASVTLTNHSISGTTNTLTNIPNSALTNNSTGLSVTSAAGSDISVPTTPAALGSSIVLNVPSGGPSSRGAITSVDWNTFNNKQAPITLTVAGTSGPATLVGPVLNIPQYSAGSLCIGCNADSLKKLPVDTTSNRNGYILAFDSTNHKWYLTPNAGSGSGITQLTGDVTAGPGSGSQAATLVTVNSNVGTFGSASGVYVGTINGKGLTTAGSTVAIQIAESQVTNLVSDLAAKQSTTLTSGHLLVGNGSNVATDVALSGDVSLTNTGATTVGGLKTKVLPSLPVSSQYLGYDGTNWFFAPVAVNTQQSVTGDGTAANKIRLVNDVTSPARGYAYMTRPAADSAKGYYEIEENFLGTLYDSSGWSNLGGFVVRGATASVSGGAINITGGSGTFTQTVELPFPSMLDNWTIEGAVKCGTVTGSSFGFGFGKRSINEFGGNFQALGRFLMTSGDGNIVLDGGGTVTQMVLTTSKLTFSTGDSIFLSVSRDGYKISVNARNLTTNSAPIDTSYFYTTNPIGEPVMDNTGRFAIYSFGGDFSVGRLKVSSRTSKNARLAIVGDSKTQGYAVTGQSLRFSDILNNYFRSTINLGGGNDGSQSWSATAREKILLRSQQMIITSPSNDPRNGVDSNVTNNRLDSLYNAFTNAGIDVYYALPFAETSGLDQNPIMRHMLAAHPDKCINTNAPTLIPGSIYSDGIHLLNFGDSGVARAVLNYPKLYGANTRYGGSGSSSNSGTVNTVPKFVSSSILGNSAISDDGTRVSVQSRPVETVNGGFAWNFPSATTDQKLWNAYTDAGSMHWATTNDIRTTNVDFMQFTRSGNSVSKIDLRAPVTITSSATALTIPAVVSQSGIVFSNNITGAYSPIVDNISVSSGTSWQQQNGSTASGASAIIYLGVGNTTSASGSPSVNFRLNAISKEYVVGANAATGDFNINYGNFNQFSSGNLFRITNTGLIGLGLAPTAYMHLAASTTANASLRLPSGAAPTSPNHGDMWTDASHIYARLAGTTYQLDQQTASGVTTVGSFSGSSQTNGASISGSTITFGPADGTNAGMIKPSGSQTLGVTLTMPAPLLTSLTTPGANDSVLTVDPSTGQTHGSGRIISGSYTSTLTNTTNISSSSFAQAYYLRIGTKVHVTVAGSLTPTSALTNSALTFTLPFTTGVTAVTGVGSGAIQPNFGGVIYVSGLVNIASGTTGTFVFYSSSTTTSSPFSFSFDYTL